MASTVACARCGETMSKRKTLATDVEYGYAANRSKDKAQKGGHEKGLKPTGARYAKKVVRACRDGKACHDTIQARSKQKEEAPGVQG